MEIEDDPQGQQDRNFAQPVFIVGPGRSGSTLLRAMLNSHTELDISKESYFIPTLRNVWRKNMSREEIVDFVNLLQQFPRPPEVSLIDYLEWDRDVLAQVLFELRESNWQEVVIAIFTTRTKQLGKKYWGNKTPDYGLRLPAIIEIFPQSKIIFLIRDGRDVTLSYQSCDWGPDNFYTGGVYWRRHLCAYQSFCEAYPDAEILLVKYEDLTANPQRTLAQLCDFVGVNYESQMLDFNKNLSRHFKADAKMEHHQKLKQTASSDRNYRWKNEVSMKDRAIFQGICADCLELADYEKESFSLGYRLWSLTGWSYYHIKRLKDKAVRSIKWYRQRLFVGSGSHV